MNHRKRNLWIVGIVCVATIRVNGAEPAPTDAARQVLVAPGRLPVVTPTPAPPYDPAAALHGVQSVYRDWYDVTRKRPVTAKVHYPDAATAKASCPVVIFSHGLGGSRDGYEYLGRHWASRGYVSIHLEHEGSDTDAVAAAGGTWMENARRSAASLDNIINRPKDVSFAIDRLEAESLTDPVLRGRLDLKRIGAAGHSFGAHTTLAVAGQQIAGPRGGVLKARDPRVRAAIEMSAPVPRSPEQHKDAFNPISIPMLHMTGTLDADPLSGTPIENRRVPFDQIHRADQFLVVFRGGDHMVFSGRAVRVGDRSKDPRFHELARQCTTAFWDAYMVGDEAAKRWLADGGFEKTMGEDGTFEKKAASGAQP